MEKFAQSALSGALFGRHTDPLMTSTMRNDAIDVIILSLSGRNCVSVHWPTATKTEVIQGKHLNDEYQGLRR